MSEAAPLGSARWLTAAATRRVLDALEQDGIAVRFVGGCVRDTLLEPALDMIDLDIATPAPPERNVELLAACGIRSIPTGIDHGTITALVDDRSFEITTLRRDVATDGRRAVVAFTDCFLEDARRRDFTINTLSCDRRGRLYDPFDGRRDLEAGRIRFVGSAVERIREDYLRILRFFRFFARLGKVAPEPATLDALAAERAGLDRLSGERLRAELLKLLVGQNVAASLKLMDDTGVWQEIIGAPPALDRFARLLAMGEPATPILRLAALIRGRADPGKVASRLKLANAERDRLVELATAALPPVAAERQALRRLAYRLGAERAREYLMLAAAERGSGLEALGQSLKVVEHFDVPTLPVGGRDLLELGLPAGPELGRKLRRLEEVWIASDFSLDRDDLLGLIQSEGDRQ